MKTLLLFVCLSLTCLGFASIVRVDTSYSQKGDGNLVQTLVKTRVDTISIENQNICDSTGFQFHETGIQSLFLNGVWQYEKYSYVSSLFPPQETTVFETFIRNGNTTERKETALPPKPLSFWWFVIPFGVFFFIFFFICFAYLENSEYRFKAQIKRKQIKLFVVLFPLALLVVGYLPSKIAMLGDFPSNVILVILLSIIVTRLSFWVNKYIFVYISFFIFVLLMTVLNFYHDFFKHSELKYIFGYLGIVYVCSLLFIFVLLKIVKQKPPSSETLFFEPVEEKT